MPAWTITSTDSDVELRAGNAPTAPAAWDQAAAAALDELTRNSELVQCAATVGGARALIVAGRTVTGELDLTATRAAVAQLVLAVTGEHTLGTLFADLS